MSQIEENFNGMTGEAFMAGHEILRQAADLDPSSRLKLLEDISTAISYEIHGDQHDVGEVDAAILNITGTLGDLVRHRESMARAANPQEVIDLGHDR